MREILFMGKRIDNGEWVYGYVVKHVESCWIYTGDVSIVEGYTNEYGLPLSRAEKYEVDPETVCQYIDIIDTGRNMIFENDILERDIFGNKVIGVVVWRNIGMTGFFLKVGDKLYPISKGRADNDESEECDDLILGNVFDNPELLEVNE